MKFGLWFLPAVAIGTVGTLLAASLPMPPTLPNIRAWVEPAHPTQVAAAPGPSIAGIPTAPPARAIARPRDATAAVAGIPGAGPKRLARRPARQLAKATSDHHPRTLAHAGGPRYGAIVPAPPPGLYPGLPIREPTQIAMAPPPYGMAAPYWRAPYRPY
jgi:hypothetical protein